MPLYYYLYQIRAICFFNKKRNLLTVNNASNLSKILKHKLSIRYFFVFSRTEIIRILLCFAILFLALKPAYAQEIALDTDPGSQWQFETGFTFGYLINLPQFFDGPTGVTEGTYSIHFNSLTAAATGTAYHTIGTLQAGTYLISIDVGDYNNSGFPTAASITSGLRIGGDSGNNPGTILPGQTVNEPTPIPGTYETWTYEVTIPSNDPQIGQEIGFSFGVARTSVDLNLSLDNLRFTFTSAPAEETNSVEVTVAKIGQYLEARSNLILQHTPDLTRRIDRLENRLHNNGGVHGFGLNLNDGAIPFNLNLDKQEVSFAYSLQKSLAPHSLRSFSDNIASALDGIERLPFQTDAQDQNSATRLAVNSYAKYSDSTYASQNMNVEVIQISNNDHHNKTKIINDQDSSNTQAHNLFDFWIEAQYSRFDVEQGDGDFATTFLGVDYLVQNNVLVGLALQADWTELEASDDSMTEGYGFLITPYATAKLSKHLYIDARAGWGRSYNKVSPFDTYTDDFNAARWIASAALIGSYQWHDYKVIPEARLSYFTEDTQTYTDSLGSRIPSIEIETASLEFGPTISREFVSNHCSYAPFITVEGIWTFTQENDARTLSNVSSLSDRGLRARIETGVDLYSKNYTRFNLAANYDGIGESDFESWGVTLQFSKEF